MVNTQLFQTLKGALLPDATARNQEQAPAYALSARHQLAQIARMGSWQMVRQNLNTYARQGVFELEGMAEVIAAKLRDPKAVAQARVLPFQLMAAFKASSERVPVVVRGALQDASCASGRCSRRATRWHAWCASTFSRTARRRRQSGTTS